MPAPKDTETVDERLVAYLKKLRQGYGLLDDNKPRAIPPSVVTALDIDRSLPPDSKGSVFFSRLVSALKRMQQHVPDEAELARVALNLTKRPDKWLKRVDELARKTRQSGRSVVRQTDAALTLLAEEMTSRAQGDESSRPEAVALARLKQILDRRQEVRVASMDVTIRVYSDHVDVQEIVEVVSQSSQAQFYVVGKTLPYKRSRVVTQVLEGAELLDVEQPNEHWLLELLSFPEPVPNGETHRFSVVHDARAMAPMWTASTFHEADELRVRVWYADKTPRPVWLIDDFPPNLLRGEAIEPIVEEHGTPLDVDRLGNAGHVFTNLKRDHTYGLSWTTLEN